MQTLIRLAIKALAFIYLLPLIHGISFHGGFIAAFVLAILFSLMLWGVEMAAILISTYFAISTIGLALLVLIPVWLFGFWLLPAVALKLVSHFMPQYLGVVGWGPAILGGLLLLAVSMLTGGLTTMKPKDS